MNPEHSSADDRAIKFHCPACDRRLKARQAQFGKVIACPQCHRNVLVPSSANEPATLVETAAPAERSHERSTGETDHIRFRCDGCGKSLKVKPRQEGKSFRCPRCQAKQRVPGSRQEPVAPTRAAADESISDEVKFSDTSPIPAGAPVASVAEGDWSALSDDWAGPATGEGRAPVAQYLEKQSAGGNGAVYALVGGGAAGLVGAIVLSVGYLISTSGPSSPTVAEAANAVADAGMVRETNRDPDTDDTGPARVAKRPESGAASNGAPATEMTALSGRVQEATRSPDRMSGAKVPQPERVATSSPVANDISTPVASNASTSESTNALANAPATGKLSVRQIVERVQDSAVFITIIDALGQEAGLGSGFVIDDSGLVATNFHVVESAAKAEVQLRDGTKIGVAGYRAVDQANDLAILELETPPRGIAPLVVDRGVDPKQGEEVVALGHPAGFKFTVTTGIVSAVRPTPELPETYQLFLEASPETTWIQTTAAISGGNSGGPLLSERGELIGINTWVADGENLGFAVHVQHLADLQSRMESTATPLPVPGGPEEMDPRIAEILASFLREFQSLVASAQGASAAQAEKMLENSDLIPNHMRRFIQLAEDEAGEEVALQALVAACEIARTDARHVRTLFKKATNQLLEEFADRTELGEFSITLIQIPSNETRTFLRELVETTGNRDVEGMATFALAMVLANHENTSERHADEIVELLNRSMSEFGEIEVGSARLADLADEQLFIRQHLSIGQPAENIVGRDLDGAEFSLEDYRGQVVVLDFWADWCPYCREMYPLERQLVQRYQGMPFALLGINCDEKSRVQNVVNLNKVTWRSWWDGPGGPIARRWRVQSFPTVYVLDHKGIIRFKDVRGSDLERAVAILMEEAQRDDGSRRGRRRRSR